jgi:hypothetical protein
MREEREARLTAGWGSSGRTRRQRFWATRAMGRGERNIVGEREMNRGRLRGLQAGPTCSGDGCQTASRTGRASASRPCAGGWATPSWATAALAQDAKGKGLEGEACRGEKTAAGPRTPGRPTTRKRGRGKGQAAAGLRQGSRPKRGGFGGFFSYFLFNYNLLLSAYFMETKQLHTRERKKCMARHDATTKGRIHFYDLLIYDIELTLFRILKMGKV